MEEDGVLVFTEPSLPPCPGALCFERLPRLRQIGKADGFAGRMAKVFMKIPSKIGRYLGTDGLRGSQVIAAGLDQLQDLLRRYRVLPARQMAFQSHELRTQRRAEMRFVDVAGMHNAGEP